ncbi:MAG: InlB B-repeat-containing protein, partial [Clostridiales bacterium]
MKKPKKRLLWLGITAIMVLMFAISASTMAANLEMYVQYKNIGGDILDTEKVIVTESRSGGTSGQYGYYASTTITNDNPYQSGYNFTHYSSEWNRFKGNYQKGSSLALVNTGYKYNSPQTLNQLINDSSTTERPESYLHVFTAKFSPIPCNITLNNPVMAPGATTSIVLANKLYNSTENLPMPTPGDIFIAPHPGYTFIGWRDATNKTYTPNPTTIPYRVQGDATLNAVWEKDLNDGKIVKFVNGDNGILYNYVQRPLDSTPLPQLNPPTKPGYTFTGWSTTKGGTVTLLPTANIPFGFADPELYYAVFTADDNTLLTTTQNVTITDEGTAALATKYKTDADVKFKVNPSAGYAVDTVTLTSNNGINIVDLKPNAQGVYSFKMPAGGGAISATAVKNVFAITEANPTDATINGVAATAKVGDIVNFTASATDTNNVVQSVKVTYTNGGTAVPLSKSADGTYSFTMPNQDVTITPTVVQDSFAVTIQAGNNSNITDAPTSTVKAGDTVTFKAAA